MRENQPDWFASNQMLGGVCYADLWADGFKGLQAHMPSLKELGLTYLHLMPPYLCPQPHNDGGYAVSSYREVNPALGRIDDLRALEVQHRHRPTLVAALDALIADSAIGRSLVARADAAQAAIAAGREAVEALARERADTPVMGTPIDALAGLAAREQG